ncbi:MAG: hypothetical protein ACREE6_16870, partial [Limisphaerales bacterium]
TPKENFIQAIQFFRYHRVSPDSYSVDVFNPQGEPSRRPDKYGLPRPTTAAEFLADKDFYEVWK